MGFLQMLFGDKSGKVAWVSDTMELEQLTQNASSSGQGELPAYLLYPYDPIAQKMFEPHMAQISNARCGYQFKLYTEAADPKPNVRFLSPRYDVHECHVYWKQDSPSWYSITIMKTESAKSSNLRNWVEAGSMFGAMQAFLNLPDGWQCENFKEEQLDYLGESRRYNELHTFDESHAYCYVFHMNGKIYKKFILCARKDIYAWKVECNIESQIANVIPTDFVPPGMTLGSFFPK